MSNHTIKKKLLKSGFILVLRVQRPGHYFKFMNRLLCDFWNRYFYVNLGNPFYTYIHIWWLND